MTTYTKDPAAVIDYTIDWADFLGAETITTSTWTVPVGITNVSNSHTTTTTTIRLSGGTANTDYELVNHIVTSATREDERTITIQVRNVESGSLLIATVGGSTSNSYVTLAEAQTYFARRPYSDAWNISDIQELSLYEACQEMEQLDYIGIPVGDTLWEEGLNDTPTQALKWPRVLNKSGDLIRKYPSTSIPQPIKNAQCEIAIFRIQNGGTTSSTSSLPLKSQTLKIGSTVSLQKEFDTSGGVVIDTSVDPTGLPTKASRWLAGLRLYSIAA